MTDLPRGLDLVFLDMDILLSSWLIMSLQYFKFWVSERSLGKLHSGVPGLPNVLV